MEEDILGRIIPVKKDNYYDIEIKDLSHKGQGVGDYEGFTIFVPGVLIGDEVKVKIVRIRRNFALGELVEILKPSQDRIQNKCPVAYNCGGCQIQNLDYEAQLNFKTDLVKQNLKRIGGLEDIIVHKCIGMESPWRYRNKSQLPLGIKSGKKVVGFYATGSHDIVPTESCLIQHESADRVLKVIKKFVDKYDINIYDEKTGKGLLRHIVIRVGFNTDEIMVILVINGRDIPYKNELIEIMRDKLPLVETVVLNINTKKTNRILGQRNTVIYGNGRISERLGDLKFMISPLSFFQINTAQTKILYEKAVEYAGLKGEEVVFDLYSGTGTISLFMAKKARKVYGIEVVRDAIVDAEENARINNIENTEFVLGAAENVVPELYRKGVKADVVVVDPPRKGCALSLLDTIIKMAPKRIIYISCNPSTLARDLHILDEGGFKAQEIQPVDMFPHTAHVECVIKIQRVK